MCRQSDCIISITELQVAGHKWVIPDITNRWSMTSMSNRWVISWLVIDYWWWWMSNGWVTEAQKLHGLSITHRWHWLLIDVIDYSSMTHWLLINYTAHKSCTIFLSVVILLSVLDVFFLIAEVPVDDVKTWSANSILGTAGSGVKIPQCRKKTIFMVYIEHWSFQREHYTNL